MEYLQAIIRQLSVINRKFTGSHFGNSQVYPQGYFSTTFGNLSTNLNNSFKGFKYFKKFKNIFKEIKDLNKEPFFKEIILYIIY